MDNNHIHTEKELLARVAEADEAAFTVVFEQYRKKVYSIALMLTDEDDIAEEMVQEVFLKVWTNRSTLPDLADFNAWLFIVTRNAAYKTLQKMAHSKKVVQDAGYHLPEFSNETDDSILYHNYQQVLREAIDRLPPQQKAVWLMAKEEGLKRAEIAERMRLKPDTVKEYLSLASKSIRVYCLQHIDLSVYITCLWLMK